MTTVSTAPDPVPNQVTPLRRRMGAEHAALEALLEDVAAAFDCGDRALAAEAFNRLEKELLDHLAYEDERLLPVLERIHPGAAGAFAADHSLIRSRLHELGVGVELHYIRATAIAELVELLRAHARREDAVLYRLAEDAGLVRERQLADDQC